MMDAVLARAVSRKGPRRLLERVMQLHCDDATLAVSHTHHLPVRPGYGAQSLVVGYFRHICWLETETGPSK